MSTIVEGVDLVFNAESLGEILYVHVNGFDIYVKRECPMVREKEDDKYLIVKYSQGREIKKAKKMYKADMKAVHKLFFEFVNIYVLPRSEKRHEGTYINMSTEHTFYDDQAFCQGGRSIKGGTCTT